MDSANCAGSTENEAAMRTLQLYATGAATATSVANVTVPVATTIKGAYVTLVGDATADNSTVRIELSKVPTNQIGVNGAQDPFLEFGTYLNVGAAGAYPMSLNTFYPLDVSCRQGEIIYIHANVTTTTYYVNVIFIY